MKSDPYAPPAWKSIREASGLSVQCLDLVRPHRSLRLMCVLFTLGIVIVLLSLIFAPWTQTIFGSGRVIAYSPRERQQNIEAPIDGRISTWHVNEGQHVKAGDRLLDIVDIDPNIMDRLVAEKNALDTKLQAAQKNVDVSKINLERQRQLWKEGLSSRRAFELAELEYGKFLSEVSSASAELARLATRISRQSAQTVTAPRDGIIQRIVVAEGIVLVKQGDHVATLVPESEDRAVELYVSGLDVPLIDKGRPVRLQFEGWPAVQFSGWPSVAIGTFPGRVEIVDPSDDGTGKFRIVVFQDGDWPDARYLKQGSRVIGWVTLENVSLGWELWRRFNAFPLYRPSEADKSTYKAASKVKP